MFSEKELNVGGEEPSKHLATCHLGLFLDFPHEVKNARPLSQTP
jgi:hypothetical protein